MTETGGRKLVGSVIESVELGVCGERRRQHSTHVPNGPRPDLLPHHFPLFHHHFFLTRKMPIQSGSVSFQRLLESALLRYEKKTGVTLSKHPLALQLQSCNSVEDFNNLLQDKAKDVRESERITKSMKTIVSILTPLSFAASLPDSVGLVR